MCPLRSSPQQVFFRIMSTVSVQLEAADEEDVASYSLSVLSAEEEPFYVRRR